MKIIDNCVSLGFQNFLIKELYAPNLNWVFDNDVTDRSVVNNPGFSNVPFKDGVVTSTAYWFLYPLLFESCSKLNIDVVQLLRIRIGIYLNRNINVPNSAHIDQNKPHTVGLYYPEDFDGDTVFYADQTSQIEIARVTPKKGRMVIFDGSTYHASSNPTKSKYRVTVNFNFISNIK